MSRPFWTGFIDGIALSGAAFVAFAGVLRRGFKGDFPAVLYDSKSMWWTEDEKQERLHAYIDRMNAEYDDEDPFPDFNEGPVH